MKLTDHFSLEELTFSETALRLGLDNTPPAPVAANLKRLAEQLETVRSVLGGRPLVISSGYRSLAVNEAVGGSMTSGHLLGLAADFVCPAFGTPLAICQELVLAGVQFDQLIQEGRWVHFAIPVEGKGWRRDILTAHFKGGRVTYTRGLE
jgi:hypothetical protein